MHKMAFHSLILAGAFFWLFSPVAHAQSAAEEAGAFEKPVVIEAPTLPADSRSYGEPPANPATTYFPVLPYESAPDATPLLVPVASNHPLDGDHAAITRAIIVIHDVSRDANSALGLMTALAGSQNAQTMIIAPQFLLGSDIARYADRLPNDGHDLARWGFGAWEDGGDSTQPSPQKSVSSFTVMDLLVMYFAEKPYFPNLKEIIVAGHGAGGDFVLRYAAAAKAPDLLDDSTKVRFIAANPATFLYFTASRPLSNNKPGIAIPDASKCPTYDHYKYGLTELNAYASRAGSNAIRLRYPSRSVTYITGEKIQSDDHFPDASCAAMLQGANRLVRLMNYDLYLNAIFSGHMDSQQFSTVPKAGYDPGAVLGSPCGMSVLFGDGTCRASSVTGSKNLQ